MTGPRGNVWCRAGRRGARLGAGAAALAAAVAFGLLVACSPTAPTFTRNPPPTVVVHDGVAWRLRLSFRAPLQNLVTLELGLRNLSSDTVRGMYAGDTCPLSRIEAYRPGRWNRPVWTEPDTTACPAVPRRPVLLYPGDSTSVLLWTRRFDADVIPGDSLPSGYYRIGVRDVPLDPMPDSVFLRGATGWRPDTAELVAASPVELFRGALVP